MQRPRNRQGHIQQNDRGRGRGRGRGGFRSGRENAIGTVPNIQQVVPGAFVSLVLKADQPTGREVQGVVADVLTNGNHPRGIKVRLVDGRVGRVQRMVSEETARAGSEGMSGLGRNGEVAGGGAAVGRFASSRYHDVREDEEALPPAGYSLEAFLPVGHPLNQTAPPGSGSLGMSPAANSIHPTEGSATQVCPVCGEFEGDEMAVSHHVAEHFD